ncbi:hypothetical protein H9Q10_00035 [Eikenella sp. S3360]|uniref:Uncharacterized protein n=1 Tax=Eikenella glucosivorans TaxID=2766967 RepID=A0ABS0N6Y8_9NEIS|nr:hypothetical protein [Eikenella glucosivorans]MBH5328065.1 hypothetical protein [Eikenella glucosivorans]
MNNLDERYRAPQSENTGSRSQGTPELWNPNAAACWSLLFSPVFGAALHMLNARAMGDQELEKLNKVFMWGMVAVILLSVPIALIFNLNTNFVGLALLGAWYGGVGRKQVALVKDELGNDYPRKPWGKAIGLGCVGILALLAYGAGMGILLYALGLYTPIPE